MTREPHLPEQRLVSEPADVPALVEEITHARADDADPADPRTGSRPPRAADLIERHASPRRSALRHGQPPGTARTPGRQGGQPGAPPSETRAPRRHRGPFQTAGTDAAAASSQGGPRGALGGRRQRPSNRPEKAQRRGGGREQEKGTRSRLADAAKRAGRLARPGGTPKGSSPGDRAKKAAGDRKSVV